MKGMCALLNTLPCKEKQVRTFMRNGKIVQAPDYF